MIDAGKVLIYSDDLLIAIETIEENVAALKEVFSILVENLLELKLQKCSFLKDKIEYLGYVIDKEGIKPNPENLKAVFNSPVPNNIRQLQSFLGLTSYFRRFIENFSIVAKSYDLTRKTAIFQLGETEVQVI